MSLRTMPAGSVARVATLTRLQPDGTFAMRVPTKTQGFWPELYNNSCRGLSFVRSAESAALLSRHRSTDLCGLLRHQAARRNCVPEHLRLSDERARASRRRRPA